MIKPQNPPQEALLAEAVDRRILHGLSLEYDHALHCMPSDTASEMRKPFFRLSLNHHRVGSWHFAKREISISRKLALSYPWYAVREVLLHEMAHQMADEVFGAIGETAHGPAFQTACKFLQADPKASGSYPALHDSHEENAISDQQRLFDRVKKLMALSSSENPHEAAAAMAKANELIVKFNLPFLEGRLPSSFSTIFLGQPALRHFREDYRLAHLLQEFYFIEGLWVSSYVLAKGKMGRVFEASGTETNLKIAAYVYDCVCNYIENKWRIFSAGKKMGRFRKSDFASGIITGFHEKLEKERYPHHLNSNERALIIKGDPHLKAFFAERHPSIRTFRNRGSAMNAGIYNQGIETGRQLSLLKGVESNSSPKVKLIGR